MNFFSIINFIKIFVTLRMTDNTSLPSCEELVQALKDSPYYSSDEECLRMAAKCYPLRKVSQNALFSTIHISFIENSLYLDALVLEDIYMTALKKWGDETAMVLINSYRVSDD